MKTHFVIQILVLCPFKSSFIHLSMSLSECWLHYGNRRITELEAELCKIKSRYVLVLKELSVPVRGLCMFATEFSHFFLRKF